MLCVNYQKISVRPSSLLLSGVLSLWVSNKTDSNSDIFIAPGDAGMGVNIIMCDVMRSELVLFPSQSVALAGVLLPIGGPHTSQSIVTTLHHIIISGPSLVSPQPVCQHQACVGPANGQIARTITESEQSGDIDCHTALLCSSHLVNIASLPGPPPRSKPSP